ncbi:MAG: DUF3343 domain-containing protein [Candidatus Omnitrophota bacterium]
MIILVFESTYFIMKAEKGLKQTRIIYNIIPTPRDISSDCGVAIKVAAGLEERVIEVLGKANVEFTIRRV